MEPKVVLPVLGLLMLTWLAAMTVTMGVATGLAVDLALGLANEGELLLRGDFSGSFAA